MLMLSQKPIAKQFLFSSLLATSLGALASETPVAGKVIVAKGAAYAVSEDGEKRALKRRSKVFVGERIETGPDSSVQIRFVDKAIVSLRENSLFNISEYQFNQQDHRQNRVVMELVTGGFRTISGSVGKQDRKNYEVKTPAASIGIRGTNYEAVTNPAGGIVVGVWEGTIDVENDAGHMLVGEQAAYNFSQINLGQKPEGLLTPPALLSQPLSQAAKPKATSNNAQASKSEGKNAQSNDKVQANDKGDKQGNQKPGATGQLAGTQNPANDAQSGNGEPAKSGATGNQEPANSLLLGAGNPSSGRGADNADTGIAADFADNDLVVDFQTQGPNTGFDGFNPELDTRISEDIVGKVIDEVVEDVVRDAVDTLGDDVLGGGLLDSPDPRLSNEEWTALFNSGLIGMGIEGRVSELDPLATTILTAGAVAGTGNFTDMTAGTMAVGSGVNAVDFNFGTVGSIANFTMRLDNSTTLFVSVTTDHTSGANLISALETAINIALASTGFAGLGFDVSLDSAGILSFSSDSLGTSSLVEINSGSIESLTYLGLSSSGVIVNGGGADFNHVSFDVSLSNTANAADSGTVKIVIDQNISNSNDLLNLIRSQLQASGLSLDVRLDGNGALEFFSTLNGQPTTLVVDNFFDSNASTGNAVVSLLGGITDGTSITNNQFEDSSEVHIGRAGLLGNGNLLLSSNKDGNLSLPGEEIVRPVATATLRGYDPQVAGHQVSWGVWESTGDGALEVIGDPNDPSDREVIEGPVYWFAAEPADLSGRSGSFSFNGPAAAFLGGGSAGALSGLDANFTVNFDTGVISNGDMQIVIGPAAANELWNVQFEGQLDLGNAIAEMTNVRGDINAVCSNCVQGDIRGLLIETGDTFVGGFDLENQQNPQQHTEGLFLLER